MVDNTSIHRLAQIMVHDRLNSTLVSKSDKRRSSKRYLKGKMEIIKLIVDV